MAVKIIVPELGESVLEATVSAWLKQEGDFVNMGDVLVELETDKVNVEVGAKSAGVLQKIQVPKGSDVKVGDVLGMIDEKQSASQPVETSKPVEAKQEVKETVVERESIPQVSPVASRFAKEMNVDINKVVGTGSDGRITKADVESYLQGASKQVEVKSEAKVSSFQKIIDTSSRSEERVRMSRRRQTIARRLLEAKQSTAMLTTFNEIDMSAMMDLRKRRNDEFQKKHGIKLGFM
ncbi:MAG TPA: dihydrolipoyllysine-residue succinyltransferase, partial [Anaerolineae bacterium]|nr:dihydrolipoyllysine-residue succinyltransferase [Anaerolineae bacterium]